MTKKIYILILAYIIAQIYMAYSIYEEHKKLDTIVYGIEEIRDTLYDLELY